MCKISMGQQVLQGKIYEALSDSIVPGVNIFNLGTKVSARSDDRGSYRISAAEGDRIEFSAAGFKSDTIYVSFSLLLTTFDCSLHRDVVSLPGVTVKNSYSSDSLKRRKYYDQVYNQPGITGRNRPANGFGISLSPASFFSRESKQNRALRRRLEKQEKDLYIDHTFPVQWVKAVTGLDGDSLSLFIYRYRPSYDFCRKTTREQMLFYINDKLREFRKANKIGK